MKDFKQEYMVEFWQRGGKRLRTLEQLADWYHEETERFDQLVCTERHKGVAMPANTHERILINRNALRIRAELFEQVAKFGFTVQEWDNAIGQAAFRLRVRNK